MWNWWAPTRVVADRRIENSQSVALVVGPKRFGAPLLYSSDGQAWEMHPLQYTRAWRVSYRYMKEGQALLITPTGVWPLSRREVDDHVKAITGRSDLTPGHKAAILQRTLQVGSPFGESGS